MREAPSEAGRSPTASSDVEDREVVDRAAADQLGVVVVAVLVDDHDRPVVVGGVGDHVVVGDDVALAVQDEAGAGGAALLARRSWR